MVAILRELSFHIRALQLGGGRGGTNDAGGLL